MSCAVIPLVTCTPSVFITFYHAESLPGFRFSLSCTWRELSLFDISARKRFSAFFICLFLGFYFLYSGGLLTLFCLKKCAWDIRLNRKLDSSSNFCITAQILFTNYIKVNPLNAELNPICYLLALLGAHHFLHVSRIRVKLLNFRLLMTYIYIYIYIYIWSTHSWCF